MTLIYAYLLIFTVNFAYLTTAKANKERLMNWLEYLNELGLVGLLYAMLFFVKTNQLDAMVVWDSGTGTMTLLGFMFFVNFLYMMVNSLTKLIKQA
mmetsp:Transcript_2855/g.3895  ORF Transcript_2855/g.3895 Transcript_2855/m.3895 type:complete len:96 (+) Transcript_2855:1830-2117(+)|eukprot:CAMPEP_0185621036 /NCGR_PEP_ID=MMETSP0436-20130131/55970_1 /TAXON_ID=626734 ORGANISM="Favella taraikaensis, Strain Fe Narragansett Bay" /NCGR_SAMPLE_ID=MMETSP0436 /ASSEMBLY_ACC=CAM_ASM_000390 /LENGTH=95 /DNA_ID=CAMNT_0028261915 /DNA_START=596 /DNA_END=883 /DNA_ORIENTATION=+